MSCPDPTCLGWAEFNGGPGDVLGDIERCDECAKFEYDEEAIAAARAAGWIVTDRGNVLARPGEQLETEVRDRWEEVFAAALLETGQRIHSTMHPYYKLVSEGSGWMSFLAVSAAAAKALADAERDMVEWDDDRRDFYIDLESFVDAVVAATLEADCELAPDKLALIARRIYSGPSE